MASEKEMLRFSEVTGAIYEESHHYMALDHVCELMLEAYNDINEGEESVKLVSLIAEFKSRLPTQVYEYYFDYMGF